MLNCSHFEILVVVDKNSWGINLVNVIGMNSLRINLVKDIVDRS